MIRFLRDVYADLETLSKDAGSADIYYPDSSTDGNFHTKSICSTDAILKVFSLETIELPERNPAVLVYSRSYDELLFPGDGAKGSGYDTDRSMVTRDKLDSKGQEFDLVAFWKEFDLEFLAPVPPSR